MNDAWAVLVVVILCDLLVLRESKFCFDEASNPRAIHGARLWHVFGAPESGRHVRWRECAPHLIQDPLLQSIHRATASSHKQVLTQHPFHGKVCN